MLNYFSDIPLVQYFDMVETFWDKLLCTGKDPIAELTKSYPNMFVWWPHNLKLFGNLFHLGIVKSKMECSVT